MLVKFDKMVAQNQFKLAQQLLSKEISSEGIAN